MTPKETETETFFEREETIEIKKAAKIISSLSVEARENYSEEDFIKALTLSGNGN